MNIHEFKKIIDDYVNYIKSLPYNRKEKKDYLKNKRRLKRKKSIFRK